MKKIILTTFACALCIGSGYSRTWTSSDGEKTFTAEYVSHTDDFVTVIRGLKKVRFKISLLSEADQKWLKEKANEASNKPATKTTRTEPGKLGEKLSGKLSILSDGAFKDHTQKTHPEFYLLYFTASW